MSAVAADVMARAQLLQAGVEIDKERASAHALAGIGWAVLDLASAVREAAESKGARDDADEQQR